MPKRILHVVTNISHYRDPGRPTGLWLSELTHAYHVFAAKGYKQQLVSPQGGLTPLEPHSLKWPHADASAKEWLTNSHYQSLLANTARPEEVRSQDFDAIYFTGGHGVMFDFPEDEELQRLTREIYERGGIVSSVCHGYCGLLNTKLSDGKLLVAGRRLTGYSWIEEVLAGVANEVPYNSEQEMKNRGALYEKALIPFATKVVVDGRLLTGQNPGSARATAEHIVQVLDQAVVRRSIQ